MKEKLKTMLEGLEKKRATLAEAFKQAGDTADFSKVTVFSGTDEEKCAKVREVSADCEKDQKSIDAYRDLERIKSDNEKAQEAAIKSGRPLTPAAGGSEDKKSQKMSIGEMFVKLGAHLGENRLKEFSLADYSLGDIRPEVVKTIMDRGTTGGWEPYPVHTGRLVGYAVRPPNFLDAMPTRQTGESAVVYEEETTLTESNVVEKAEGSAYGEAALAYTKRSVTVEKIPVFIPVTDEQLEDVPYIQSLVNQRLGEMLIRRVSYQGINGTGVSPLLKGLNTTAVSTMQTTAAVNGDGNADTIARAIKDVRVTGRSVPSTIVINPTDWLNERLRKTQDGAYIWGSPATEGMGSMWGLPLIVEDAITAGYAIVGDFRMWGAWVERRGITVKVGYNTTDFVYGKQSIRADMRGCFVWERPTAFSLITLPAA